MYWPLSLRIFRTLTCLAEFEQYAQKAHCLRLWWDDRRLTCILKKNPNVTHNTETARQTQRRLSVWMANDQHALPTNRYSVLVVWILNSWRRHAFIVPRQHQIHSEFNQGLENIDPKSIKNAHKIPQQTIWINSWRKTIQGPPNISPSLVFGAHFGATWPIWGAIFDRAGSQRGPKIETLDIKLEK